MKTVQRYALTWITLYWPISNYLFIYPFAWLLKHLHVPEPSLTRIHTHTQICVSRSSVSVSSWRSSAPSFLSIRGQSESVRVKGTSVWRVQCVLVCSSPSDLDLFDHLFMWDYTKKNELNQGYHNVQCIWHNFDIMDRKLFIKDLRVYPAEIITVYKQVSTLVSLSL